MVEEASTRGVLAAAAIVALEAAGALIFGILELAQLDRARAVVGVTTCVFFVVYAVGLAAAARGLARLRGWSRAPIVLAQAIQLGVAWSFHGNPTDWVALILAVPAIVVLFLIFTPTTTNALYGQQN